MTRRVMPYIMKGRNESAVYYEYDVGLRKTDRFIRSFNQANPATPIDPFHIAVFALREVLYRYPEMNRFVAGGRVYQRPEVWFSYGVKTKLQQGAPLVVVKRCFRQDESFEAMVAAMQAQVHEDRFGGKSYVEKELGLLMKFPGFVRRIIMAAINGLDRLGMLPPSYIEKDPMYASAVFANFASIGMGAAYHHLYEYGTAGIFCAIGRPFNEHGSPTSGPERRRSMNVKWSFDDRMGDGMVASVSLKRFKQILEDPEAAGLRVDTAPAPAPAPDVREQVDDAALP